MISLGLDRGGNLTATQQDVSPSIYLDHWAFMDIAGDVQKVKKFAAILSQRKATLYLSFMHLLELSTVNDPRHAANMESFIESISPQIFFIDSIPNNVIAREDRLIKGEGPVLPLHGDVKFLKYFVTLERKTLDPLNPRGLFSNLNEPRLKKMCGEFLQEFTNDITELRQKRENDQKYNTRVRNVHAGPPQQRATRYIWQDLVNSLIRDKMKLQNSNHYRDLFHTVIPIAYGDFCLLDKTWAAKANETIKRLRNAGHKSPMAEIFSIRTLDKFWTILESYENLEPKSGDS